MTSTEPQADRLQELLDRIAAGEPVEMVLRSAGDDVELAELVALGAHLAEVAPVKAPAPFRARLQAKLQATVTDRAPTRWDRLQPGWRVLARLVAVVVALALVVSSAVVASADSLPGEPLYGLKRAVEDTRLALTTDSTQRVQLRIERVDARLAELRKLVDRGIPLDAAVIEDLVEAQYAALAEAEATGDSALVKAANQSAETSQQSLLDLVERVDEDARPLVRGAAAAMGDVAGGAAPQGPGARPTQTWGPDAATQAAPTVAVTRESEAVVPEPWTVVSETPATAHSPTATQPSTVPSVTSSPPPPTAVPVAPSVIPGATEAESPILPTTVPDTPVPPEPTPQPSLVREDERAKTQTAEARPTRTARPPWRRPNQGAGPPNVPAPPTTGPGGASDPDPGLRATPTPAPIHP